MALSSTNKDDLSALILDTYGVTPGFNESWQLAGPRESSSPGQQKLQVIMTLSGKPGSRNAVYTAVVPDQSQDSVDIAYGRFLDAMTKALAAGRKPFGI